MEYEQALIIGKRRRADAAMALAGYVRERVTEVCAVKPAKGTGLDARDWEPVGEENFKEICIRRGPTGDEEVYLVVVDADGRAKGTLTGRPARPVGRPGEPGGGSGLTNRSERVRPDSSFTHTSRLCRSSSHAVHLLSLGPMRDL